MEPLTCAAISSFAYADTTTLDPQLCASSLMYYTYSRYLLPKTAD
jgi:hypothetical protein